LWLSNGNSGTGRKPKSVRELGVHGISKDRDDIGSGIEYVSRIRKYTRETKQK